MNVATHDEVLRRLPLSEESTVSTSFENLFRIRPVGVVSKKRIGDPTTASSSLLKSSFDALHCSSFSGDSGFEGTDSLVRAPILHDAVAHADKRGKHTNSGVYSNVEQRVLLCGWQFR